MNSFRAGASEERRDFCKRGKGVVMDSRFRKTVRVPEIINAEAGSEDGKEEGRWKVYGCGMEVDMRREGTNARLQKEGDSKADGKGFRELVPSPRQAVRVDGDDH
jgi:hypothetical protein